MNRLKIDCVNDRAGVQNRYVSIPDLMAFLNRTGRIRNYTIWAAKGNRAFHWEGDNPNELVKLLSDFNNLP